jgi:hypothetical protein
VQGLVGPAAVPGGGFALHSPRALHSVRFWRVRCKAACAQAQGNPFLPLTPDPASRRVAVGSRQPLPANDSVRVAIVSPRRGGVPGVAETNVPNRHGPNRLRR